MKASIALFVSLSLPVAAALQASADEAPAVENIRLLSFGGGPHHPYEACSRILFEYLADFGIYDCTYTEDPSALHPDSLRNCDVLLIYAIRFDHEKETPAPVQEGLSRFVEDGNGLVVVHSGVASFSSWPEFADMIGAYWRWNESTHEPYRPMMVRIADPDHPVTRGLLDFKIVDEFYFNLEPREGNHLLLTSKHQVDGEDRIEPIAWTRRRGSGRVFVNVLGHDAQPWKNTSFLKVMRRGIDWAAGRLDKGD